MKKQQLNFSDIFVGQKVIDKDEDKGEITKIENINNIYVKYKKGGDGIFCFENCCNDKLFKL